MVELAAGLGETLASGMRGSPWRLAIDKASGRVTTLAFANFSQQLLPASINAAAAAGGAGAATRSVDGLRYVPPATSGTLTAVAERTGSVAATAEAAPAAATAAEAFACKSVVLDYSKQALSRDTEEREALGRRIGAIAALLEAELGGPQDVEGCVVGQDIYIVQARPQPM